MGFYSDSKNQLYGERGDPQESGISSLSGCTCSTFNTLLGLPVTAGKGGCGDFYKTTYCNNVANNCDIYVSLCNNRYFSEQIITFG
jgi:hypothetical protein